LRGARFGLHLAIKGFLRESGRADFRMFGQFSHRRQAAQIEAGKK